LSKEFEGLFQSLYMSGEFDAAELHLSTNNPKLDLQTSSSTQARTFVCEMRNLFPKNGILAADTDT
jgi:hypothetical protein